MIESVQVRQRGGFDFDTHYDNLCALQDTCPLPAVKSHLPEGLLDLNGDRVRANDWMPILNSVRINKSLKSIAFRSYFQPPQDDDSRRYLIQKRKTPAIRSKEITYRLCRSLRECLCVSPSLKTVELQGLPLRERDLTALTKGLIKSGTVTHLSLEYSRIGDCGLEILCKGIKNSTSMNSINFSGCSLSEKGAECLAKVIKHQAMKRHNEAWRDSLRYRRPDLDRMPGIRRISINNNPMISDQGAAHLAEALKDDLWLKALDMQGCGISSNGAKSLLDVLKYNTTLVVLDVRRNPLIDREVLHSIMEQLMINCGGQDTEYEWLKADEEPSDPSKPKISQRKRRTKTLNCSFGRKATIRITSGAARRKTRSTGSLAISRKSDVVHPETGMPWRTALRANRIRGFPPEQMSFSYDKQDYSSFEAPNQSASIIITEDGNDEQEMLKLDESTLCNKTPKDLRVEIIQLRRRLIEERGARAKADHRNVELTLENKRLQQENESLRRNAGGILNDDSVLESIEASFKQFHEFLDLLRESGLGQLITMAGLDKPNIPFNTSFTNSSFIDKQNNKLNSKSGQPPRISRAPTSQKSTYYGDIYTSQVPKSHPTVYQEDVDEVIKDKGDTPHLGYPSVNDPTMTSHVNMDFEVQQSKPDDLYEKLLQDTSGVFQHLGDPNVTVNQTQDSNNSIEEKLEDKSSGREKSLDFRKSKPKAKDSHAKKNKKVDDDKSEQLSDDERDGRQSRLADVHYSMDSFDQSYVSERGELIRLDGDLGSLDLEDRSPSPPAQIVESDDDF